MYTELIEINSRPKPFQYYTADELWTNEHTAKEMLKYHLDESIDAASWNKNFIEKSVKWISSYFRIDKNTEIADFGCGPGQYSTRFAKLGAKVTGIDFSENSLNYAKKMADENDLNINYVLKNYLEFETDDHFDLIIMIMCDFCALSPEQRKVFLSKFNSLLKPEGHVLLDVHSLYRFNGIEESANYERNQLNGFWSADDYYCFVNTFKYEKEKVTLDKYTIIEESQKRVVYNWLQHFSNKMLKNEFKANGFKIKKFFSNIAGAVFHPESTEIAIVAKPS